MNEIVPLTEQARLFAAEYLVDFKVTPAAERAGLSPQHGFTLMRDPRVQALIQEGKIRTALRCAISAEWTLNNFRRIAEADITAVMRALTGMPGEAMDRQSVMARLEALPDDLRYSIKKIKWGEYGPELELHDKVAALQAIGRYFGLFTDNVNLRTPDGLQHQMIGEGMSPQEAAEAYAKTIEHQR